MTHDWDEVEPDPNQVTLPERALVLPGGQSNIKPTRGAKALSCKRSEESCRELGVWPTQELGPDCHLLFLTYGSSKEGQPSMQWLLLPTSMGACAASQCHRVWSLLSGVSLVGSCWPSLRLLCLPLQFPPSKAYHAPAQQGEHQHVSAIHPLLHCAFGKVADCQPVSLQPSGEIKFHSGESRRGTAFVFLCYGLAIIFNHYFFPVSPRMFSFANLTLSSCHALLNIILWSSVFIPHRLCPSMHHH